MRPLCQTTQSLGDVKGYKSGLATLVLDLVEVFSYEGKNIMESILSISLENVVFQESDNLFIDNPFKYFAPSGKKADNWMDQTILARTFLGQLQGYDRLQKLWKYPALELFSPTFEGVIIIVNMLMFTRMGAVGSDSFHSSSVEFAAKCCTTGVCIGH